MKDVIRFPCVRCNCTRSHDVLSQQTIGEKIRARISCRHCKADPFTIEYPSEIMQANIETNGYNYPDNPIDFMAPSPN